MSSASNQIHVDKIQLDLDEASPARRRSIVKRYAPAVQAALKAVPQRLRSEKHNWRRVVSDLEGRVLSPDDEPVYKPAYRRKELAARWALVASVVFDLVIGVMISITIFQMSVRWALLAGLIMTLVIAMLAKGLASLAVHYEHLGRWIRHLLGAAGVAFILIMAAIVVFYLVRSGLLPMLLVGLVTPAMVVACALQAGAFSALGDIFAHPRELEEGVRCLEIQQAALQALDEELREGATASVREDEEEPAGSPRPRRHGNGRFINGATRALSIALLFACVWCGTGHTADPRLNILSDNTNTGEMGSEAGRLNQLLSEHIDVFVDELGDVTSVSLIRWSDAQSIWQAGQLFEFPRIASRHSMGEAKLPFFEAARKAEEEDRRKQERQARIPVFRRIGHGLLAPTLGPISRSCVSDALNRAGELPGTDFVLVTSDLANFRCPTKPCPSPSGPVIGIVEIPRREAELRDRMLERRKAIEKAYPGVLVIESYKLTDAASLRSFGRSMKEAADRRDCHE